MLKRMLSILAILATISLFSWAEVSAEQFQEITVSAAISLKNAFDEIGKGFELKHKDSKILFNFAASGDLAKQIEAGAPVDVFASAAQKEMDELEGKGLIVSNSRSDFASNSVVLIIPVNTQVQVNSFNDLLNKDIKRIAVGNPKTVPAGRYAEEVFQYYKLTDQVKEKLVYAENVRQVLDYVARGEVDAGIVYLTDAKARANEVKVVMTAPDISHKRVVYPIAVVKETKKDGLSRAFISYVMSEDGANILKKFGFGAVK